MTIKINFAQMSGDAQIYSITVRVNTEDFALAVAKAIEFSKTVTTIEITSIEMIK